MTALQVTFWMSAAVVGYAYVGYPLLVAALAAARRGRSGPAAGPPPRSVSVVIAAYNEEAAIGRRVGEFLDVLAGGGMDGELIVVSDGSTDRTAQAARGRVAATGRAGPTQVIDLPANSGKAAALSAGCRAATRDIIVFADARQSWPPETFDLLLENFADPTVGAVSGNLVVQSSAGVMSGVGLYWRYEKWLRRQESRAGSMVGVTGAVSAVRRELFRPIPAGPSRSTDGSSTSAAAGRSR